MQGNSSLASLQHHEHNSLVSPATSWMASRRAESIVAKVTEAPSWIPVWTRWTVVSSGMWVADTSTGYSCFFSFTSTPAQHALISPSCTIPLLNMFEVHSPDNLHTCPACTIPLLNMLEAHGLGNLHTCSKSNIPFLNKLEVCGTDNLHTCTNSNIPFLPMLEVWALTTSTPAQQSTFPTSTRSRDVALTTSTPAQPSIVVPQELPQQQSSKRSCLTGISVFPTRIFYCGLCFLWTTYLSVFPSIILHCGLCFWCPTYLSLCFWQ